MTGPSPAAGASGAIPSRSASPTCGSPTTITASAGRRTPNRFSLGLEPHVRLWGVGFLPRRLARRYVRAFCKPSRYGIRLLSARSLRRLLSSHGFDVSLVPPEIPVATERLYSGIELRALHAYNRVRRVAPIRRLLLMVGPLFHAFARKR
jgi:hypothetical protein